MIVLQVLILFVIYKDMWLLLHHILANLKGTFTAQDLGPTCFFFRLFLLAQFNATTTTYLPMGLYSIPYILGTTNDCKTVFVAIWTSDSSNIRWFFFFFFFLSRLLAGSEIRTPGYHYYLLAYGLYSFNKFQLASIKSLLFSVTVKCSQRLNENIN